MVSRWTHPSGPTDSLLREKGPARRGPEWAPSTAWGLWPSLPAVSALWYSGRTFSWETENWFWSSLCPDELEDLGQVISLFWASIMFPSTPPLKCLTRRPSASSSLSVPAGTSSAQGYVLFGEKARGLPVVSRECCLG